MQITINDSVIQTPLDKMVTVDISQDCILDGLLLVKTTVGEFKLLSNGVVVFYEGCGEKGEIIHSEGGRR